MNCEHVWVQDKVIDTELDSVEYYTLCKLCKETKWDEQPTSMLEIQQQELLLKTDALTESLLALEKEIRPLAEACQELHKLVRKL